MLEFWVDPNTRLWLIGVGLIVLSLIIRALRAKWPNPPSQVFTGLAWAVVAAAAAANVAQAGVWSWSAWLLQTMAAIGTLAAGYEGILKHIYNAIDARKGTGGAAKAASPAY